MTTAQTSQLYAVVITALVLGFVVMRRMRPQPVRPNRLLVGGAVIVLLVAFSLVGTIVLRFGVRAVLTGNPFGSGSFNGPHQHGFLYDLSADLLFLTLGLWVARAFLVYQRHRQHVTTA